MIKSNFYKIVNIICVLMLAAATISVLLRWAQVPDEIPIHYNFAGEPDGYGGKGSLIIMMVMAWVVFLTITISAGKPDKWNMPVRVTEENKARLYAIARAMLEVTKVLVTLLFVLMFINLAAAKSMLQWQIIALIGAILLTVIIGFIMIYKNK